MASQVPARRATGSWQGILPVLCCCLLLLSPPGAYAAQAAGGEATVQLPAHFSEAQARDLMARLSDDQVRELLLQRLDAVATGAEPEDNWIRGAERARRNVDLMLSTEHGLLELPSVLWERISDQGELSFFGLLLRLLAAGLVALLTERLFRRLLSPTLNQGPTLAQRLSTGGKLRLLSLDLVTRLALLAVFGITAFATSVALLPSGSGSVTLFSELLRALVVGRGWALLSRLALAPDQPALRLPNISSGAAGALHRTFVGLMWAMLAHRLIVNLMGRFGMSPPYIELWKIVGSLLWIMLLVLVLWMARQPVAAKLRQRAERAGLPQSQRLDLLIARWHLLATGYVMLIWSMGAVVSLSTGAETLTPALISLAVGALLPLANRSIYRIAGMILEQGRKNETRTIAEAVPSESEKARMEEYRPLVIRNLRIMLTIGVVALLVRVWGINVGGLMEALIGSRLADSLVDITLILVITYALWGTVKVAIGRRLGPEGKADAAPTVDEPGGTGLSRVETLLPLLSKTMKVTLIVAAGLVCLSELGVDIGPLLAGAGVAGIAIGFGAQSLVRDVVSGFFFLLDDAFRMGEYVEIDQIRGTVQKISTRSLQLRHHNGPVHTVPFGEIRHLTNYSRDWAIMKFEIRVPFETDVDKVRRLIKRAGVEMMQDPELAPLMLEPLKSQGVVRMDDSALIMRCKFTSRPGQQFYLRREAFVRIQRLFEQKGIHFAPRRVIVESAAGQPPPSPAAAAAAAGSMDRQFTEERPQGEDDSGPG